MDCQNYIPSRWATSWSCPVSASRSHNHVPVIMDRKALGIQICPIHNGKKTIHFFLNNFCTKLHFTEECEQPFRNVFNMNVHYTTVKRNNN